MELKGELAKALSKLQGELRSIKKEGMNPFFKAKYIELDSVCDYVMPLLSANGLSVTQVGIIAATGFQLETSLMHTSGEKIVSLWPVCSSNEKQQAIGAATTYARRYALMALLGLSANNEDDDGHAATHKEVVKDTKSDQKKKTPIKALTVAERLEKLFVEKDFDENQIVLAAQRAIDPAINSSDEVFNLSDEEMTTLGTYVKNHK